MFRELLQGLSVTFRHLFRKKVTVQYPEQREKTFPRTHGRHFLRRHPDGLERCVGCTLCAGACPANAIFVQAGENTPENRVSPGERHAAVYKINMIRCIDCGYCVQACPVYALGMTDIGVLVSYDRKGFIYDKEMLLEPYPGAIDKPEPE